MIVFNSFIAGKTSEVWFLGTVMAFIVEELHTQETITSK